MLSRTIDSYGGVFVDEHPVENPQTEQSSAFGNRLHEDVAQGSRTSTRIIVRFLTTTAAAPATVATTDGRSHYGTGTSQHPTTIQKLSTGTYRITYPVSFIDPLGVLETVAFYAPFGYVESLAVGGRVQCTTPGNNVIDLIVIDSAGSVSDLGGGVQIAVRSS